MPPRPISRPTRIAPDRPQIEWMSNQSSGPLGQAWRSFLVSWRRFGKSSEHQGMERRRCVHLVSIFKKFKRLLSSSFLGARASEKARNTADLIHQHQRTYVPGFLSLGVFPPEPPEIIEAKAS